MALKRVTVVLIVVAVLLVVVGAGGAITESISNGDAVPDANASEESWR